MPGVTAPRTLSVHEEMRLFGGVLATALRRPSGWIAGTTAAVLGTMIVAVPWVTVQSAISEAPEAETVQLDVRFATQELALMSRCRAPISRTIPMGPSPSARVIPPCCNGHSRLSLPNPTAFGASERFAVSPGRETEGYLQLPGGPSGHPLSPFYRSGFDDWAEGKATPFLPGPAAHRLVLKPHPEAIIAGD